MQLHIHTDGGARGNPGPAAVGVVIEETTPDVLSNGYIKGEREQKKKIISSFGVVIGETTNNVAEYTAVIKAFEKLKTLSLTEKEQGNIYIDFFLDSVLVVNQLKGVFKIKENHLRELAVQVHSLEREVGGVVQYSAVPREQNIAADALVNQALNAVARL